MVTGQRALFTDWGEAQDNMKVLTGACKEEVHHILWCGWAAWVFSLHDRDQFTHYLTLFITVKQIADHSWNTTIQILNLYYVLTSFPSSCCTFSPLPSSFLSIQSINPSQKEMRELIDLPEESTLLRYSRKASSFTSWSVKMNVVPLPWIPHVRYNTFRSSSKLAVLYDLQDRFGSKWQRYASLWKISTFRLFSCKQNVHEMGIANKSE